MAQKRTARRCERRWVRLGRRGGEVVKMDTTKTTVLQVRVDALHPNDYNPNEMTEAEFAELVAEVRHLGRLPKPVVVRRKKSRYIIVDGEHNWRAAKEVGLSQVPCEVIDADETEAMRQTYKRNQHGTHNQVKLGRMFERALAGGEISQRELAEGWGVSEGTVRNAVEYSKAASVRNDYAFDKLTIKQVRVYNRLPAKVGELWLKSGASIEALWGGTGAKNEREAHELEERHGIEGVISEYPYLEQTGLFEFVHGCHSAQTFVDAVRKLRKWDEWERGWARGGIKREELRAYACQFFKGAFRVREQWQIDDALGIIVDSDSKPAKFLIPPDEFEAILKESEGIKENHLDFVNRLQLAIAKRTGKKRERKGKVREELVQIEIDGSAPEYIKASALPAEEKYELWKAEQDEIKEYPADVFEQAKSEIARLSRLDREKDEHAHWTVMRAINAKLRDITRRAQWESMSEIEIAQSIAERFYDKSADPKRIDALATKLATLEKVELFALEERTQADEHLRAMMQFFAALARR